MLNKLAVTRLLFEVVDFSIYNFQLRDLLPYPRPLTKSHWIEHSLD